jgi:hypothetical protein
MCDGQEDVEYVITGRLGAAGTEDGRVYEYGSACATTALRGRCVLLSWSASLILTWSVAHGLANRGGRGDDPYTMLTRTKEPNSRLSNTAVGRVAMAAGRLGERRGDLSRSRDAAGEPWTWAATECPCIAGGSGGERRREALSRPHCQTERRMNCKKGAVVARGRSILHNLYLSIRNAIRY